MPKEIRTSRTAYAPLAAPYPTPDTANSIGTRNTGIWSTGDDERLLQARAAESSWQLVAEKYFPGKTSNACRKRYERLVEKRNVEDWDSQKRGELAQEYLKMRRELWEPLAAKMGVKWTVAEAKVRQLFLSLWSVQWTDMATVHGYGPQTDPGHSSHGGPERGSRLELCVRQPRYLRPSQRFRHRFGLRC